jgi:hypothetical protein
MKLLIVGGVLGAAAYGWLVPSTVSAVQDSNRAWCIQVQHDYRTKAGYSLPDTATISGCAKLGISVLH